jgi:gluconate 5-dehydrogenase
MPANFDLTGRLALDTGASRGPGGAIARGLAGAAVLLHGRNTTLLDAHLAEPPGAAGRRAFNVSDPAAMRDATARITREFGRPSFRPRMPRPMSAGHVPVVDEGLTAAL